MFSPLLEVIHTFVRNPWHPSLVLQRVWDEFLITSSFFMLDEDPAMFCDKLTAFVNLLFTRSELSSCFL